MTDDTRDRVIALERDVKHLSETIEAMGLKVSEMHALMLQARGIKWMILGMAAVGGFLASKVGFLWQFFVR